MDAVGHRLQAGLSWLTSASNLRNLTLFDTLSVPFTDLGIREVSEAGTSAVSQNGEATAVYVDQSGRQISGAELEAMDRSAFSDSPWGFIASRYALTLGVMAIVVNRITHICRPQGRPRPLPALKRLGIQLPTMMFLGWSGFLLLLVTLHSFFEGFSLESVWLPVDVRTILHGRADQDAVQSANSTLLWRLFLSVCFAVVSSTLLRTLEGHNTIVNPDDLGNSPTFNLVGFAVLLHLHASSHAFPPNKHVYLSILFQVGEVLGLQACTCWTSPPVSRLTLTSVVGLTSTVHYLLAIRSGDRGYPLLQSFSRAPDVALIAVIILTLFLHALTAAITSTPLSFSRLVDPRSLPLPTDDYSLALFKIGTACLTSTKLSGLDADLIDIQTSSESWIEVDGAQVRIRQADGSLAKPGSGQRTGLGNEIRRIRSSALKDPYGIRAVSFHERWRFVKTLFHTLSGLFTWIGRKVASLLPFELPTFHAPNWLRNTPRYVRLAWHGSNGEERRQRILDERRRREELRSAAAAAERARRDQNEGAGRALGNATATSTHSDTLRRRDVASSNVVSSPSSWHRHLMQHEFDDDDDDDQDWQEGVEEVRYVSQATGREDLSDEVEDRRNDYWGQLGSGSRLLDELRQLDNAIESDEDEDDDQADWHDEVEPADVSAELLSLARRDFDEDDVNASVQESYARILMAHMSSPSSRILTRGKYRDLLGLDGRARADAEILADVIQQRRGGTGTSAVLAERERMRLCVICYVEDRTIICWPCKCLALCDACREAMAARPPPRAIQGGGGVNESGSGAATHTCPTCRTPVIGFSRIFLP